MLAAGGAMTTALSKTRTFPLLAALALVISVGAAVAWKYLQQFLERKRALDKRRKARLSLLEFLGKKGSSPPKIQRLVAYSLPDLQNKSEPRVRLGNIVEKMNAALPCCSASFCNLGSGKMEKQALLSFLGKPDMSAQMTHCLYVVGDDATALKLLLHCNLHKGEYYAVGGPFFRGAIEMDIDFALNLEPEGKEDPILMAAFLRFKADVTDDSEVFKQFLKAVEAFNGFPGIQAALRPAGHNTMLKEELIAELQWNDSTRGMTHCLMVAAESPQKLKDLQSSEEYGKWLMMEMPHLSQEPGGMPPAAIFYFPMTVTAKC